MNKSLRKWIFGFAIAALFMAGLLVIIILNPVLLYAHATTHGKHTIYHDQPVDPSFIAKLGEATQLVKNSVYYDKDVVLDICMDDGSKYPSIVRAFQGQAFATGFYNKVVVMSQVYSKDNYAVLNGYKWNLNQLLAHEMIHCYQFSKRGFWHSNPVANIPAWKWEGYPEYISRQNADQKDLRSNIRWFAESEKHDTDGWIQFADSTGTVLPYYKSWLLVKYCIDIKKMNYSQLLCDNTREEIVLIEMMKWYDDLPHKKTR